ncbi:TMEM175 family protein [Microbacterium dextranolyticum]|uniref:DUF1211 domain-containing protein n=1 Tax=Microbacterium dextranolyticum TaxID=36806 RepID=A0A9W6HK70_9MICO|nr:TMEM175 family protein [Microbacterium dextranolyticum]MBM7461642.1 putative membrane protein [Microbacterium dextranolyticum]GLJ94716.1 hypothetical protein GCM10017591_07780 [Microbacterium dextranolyticum]
MAQPETDDEDAILYPAERPKAFIDAVVAIAMTLLILPLMESVADTAQSEGSALDWLTEHNWQLTSFLLSFALIAMFWFGHQRMFSDVERVSPRLLWLTMPWLVSIVWLPVATALSGRMPSADSLTRIIYIGSMVFTALATMAVRLFLLRHHDDFGDLSVPMLRRGLSVDIATSLLFAAALGLSLLVPPLGYAALFLMFAVGPVSFVVRRMMPRGKA